MKSILEFYYSSIGKKVLMSCTGLFLIFFLTEHLVGNLLLVLFHDNGATFEAYGNFLVHNPVVLAIEIFLFASIAGHALLGIILWFTNRMKRPVKYKRFRLKDNATLSSRTMIWTGSVVFFFLVVHLRSFFFPLYPTRYSGEKISSYELVIQAFSQPWYVAFYVVALFILGYHLKHGFQSAFQTLGLRDKKYISVLDALAFMVWCVIPFLYAMIPIICYLYRQPAINVIMGVH
jgi:succinate dehydrogenase / fumarate reductase, cytochrome b subunit